MKMLLKLEELAEFLLGIWLFSQLPYVWWLFPALLLVPDLSMVGYLINTKIGAYIYNFFHHKALGITLLILGFHFVIDPLTLAGVILFAHSAMDRLMGYGLKLETDFKHTHLGNL